MTEKSAVLRMHEELAAALKKPVDKRHWVMVVDLRKCVGCHACAVSCMAENVCAPGTSYRKVFAADYGEYPKTDRFFMPTNCQQCGKPPCMAAANKLAKGAISQRTDGVVVFNYPVLAGNEKARTAAAKACPYTAIVEDNGDYYTKSTPVFEKYEQRVFFENDRKLERKDTASAIRKCTFCTHRLEAGMLPACVGTCIGQAMYFGDLNDSGSLVSELIKKEKNMRLKENEGSEPSVYYIGFDGRSAMTPSALNTCLECHS